MSTVRARRPDYSDAPDPEALRIRDELQRLRDDTEARRAFYDDLRRTVERVRAGITDEESHKQTTPSLDPASTRTGDRPESPASSQPRDTQPANSGAPQASLGGSQGTIDRAAYWRVVRWAEANGSPVPLALSVAWMESHLRTNPPRGKAGEVGMFQIMPARCRIEGWSPRRLNEPEFNAWLGTRLLARYYREEHTWARAAAKYVAGPGVFDKNYPEDVWDYINWYASSVNSYAGYFSRYES